MKGKGNVEQNGVMEANTPSQTIATGLPLNRRQNPHNWIKDGINEEPENQ